MIKGIMFDMGDTLVSLGKFDLLKGLETTYKYLENKEVLLDDYLERGSEILDQTLFRRTTFDIKCVDFFALLKRFFGPFLIDDEKLEDIFSESFMKFTEEEDIRNLLEQYQKQGYKMIVMSNTFLSSRCIIKHLEKLDLTKYFEDIIASADTLVRKPSKIFFDVGIKRLGLKKEEVIYIGNSYLFDYMGAKNTGIKIIYYNKIKRNDYCDKKFCVEINHYQELLGKNLDDLFNV